MPKPKLRHTVAILLQFLVVPSAIAAQEDSWWHGTFVNEYDTENLIKRGHARPFNCRDADAGPLTITADRISARGFECVITKVTKIPNYEIVIINSDCEVWAEDEQLPSVKSERMFLLLEPAGRMLAYHRGRIGDHHLPYTDELSACEWRD